MACYARVSSPNIELGQCIKMWTASVDRCGHNIVDTEVGATASSHNQGVNKIHIIYPHYNSVAATIATKSTTHVYSFVLASPSSFFFDAMVSSMVEKF